MKKFALTVAAVMLAALVAVPLAACGEGYSETYAGTLSKESYATKDDALTAFFENEVDGLTTKAINLNVTSKDPLTQEEIDALALAVQVESGEKWTVSYQQQVTEVALTASAPSTHEQIVYMLGINSAYHYFTPASEVGAMITRSYFEDVFDAEKYINCTMKGEQKLKVTVNVSGNKNSSTMETVQTCKMTENAVEMITKISDEDTMSVFALENSGVLSMYANYGNGWNTLSTDIYAILGMEINSLADFRLMTISGDIDHTYFEKTSTGFRISPEKYNLYAQEMMKSILDEFAGLSMAITFDVECNFFVKEGRLAKMEQSGTANIASGYAAITEEIESTYKYSDFGTTKVTVPEDLKKKLS